MTEPVLHPHQDAEFIETEDGAQGVDELYPMPPSGVITGCPKCGAAADLISTEFHPGGRLDSPCGWKFGWPDVMYLGEHICKVCPKCKFGWPEKVAHAAV